MVDLFKLVCRLTATAALLAACSSDRPTDTNSTEPKTVLGITVSEPYTGTSANIAAVTRANVVVANSVVYVSVQSGTVPEGLSARISNTAVGATVIVKMFDGGFDPVAIAASVGDALSLTITTVSGQTLPFRMNVPAKKPPVVVRSNPSKGRVDVALTELITAVFSEPIDPSSLNAASVKLLKSGQPVSSVVSLESNGWAVDVVPVSPLEPQTTYTLIVGKDVRDLDGDSLLAEDTVAFTTIAVGTSANQIVFETPGGGDGAKTIYVMNPDGTGRRALLIGHSDGFPVAFEADVMNRVAWSPDGSRLAFEYGRGALFIMNADGSGLGMPNQPGSTDILNGAPAWSPDGRRIAFGSFEWYWLDQGTGIYLTPPDIGTCCLRSSTTRLTSGNDWWPTWSPDGAMIVFVRFEKSYFINPGTDAGSDIFVMRADGSGVTQLTHKGWPISGLAWSPDGSKIAFSANTGGCQPILIMNADGSGINQLTDCAGVDHSPSFSPDGRKIVFERNQNIYTLNADGSGPLSLLATGGVNPAWSPVR